MQQEFNNEINKEFIDIYYKEIDKYKPLTLQDEKENFIKFHNTSDIKYKNNIIQSNLKWVYKIAHKYKNRGVGLDELICEGNEGMMIAFDKFNYKKFNNKFYTYAQNWIEFKIRNRVFIEKTKYEDLINRNINIYSNTIKDVIPYEEDKSYEKNVFCNELLECLSDKEKDIMKMLFGIGFEEKFTIQEVGDKYNCSGEHIRNVRNQCIDKIRNFILEKDIKFELDKRV
jgi:RNA polymerase primary sigma factor